ncbi:ubiquitin carboxyl-terminal hydrolase [Hamiltosporidium magnivora]|uniref:Ubiquitin carboxyl-terminal hydrolase n=1 Tax=Hamiltosporidium magnivora TaxID=148818 RepID=A0A4Q9LG17_9MICR|nr:ubiquitin carboxyl-terminal hydrolase [Hamiltosporidium magnivora]
MKDLNMETNLLYDSSTFSRNRNKKYKKLHKKIYSNTYNSTDYNNINTPLNYLCCDFYSSNNKSLIGNPMAVQEIRLNPRPAGLINKKNDCFFNSVMQCILSLHPLTSFYDSNVFNDNQKFSKSFQDFIRIYKSKSVVNPSDLINVLGRKIFILDSNQQDCHEFLTLFFLHLYIELNGKVNDLISSLSEFDKKKQENFIARTFFGLQKSIVICGMCNQKKEKIEHFSCLTLKLENSIYESMKSYEKEEILSGDNAWKCDFCGKKNKTTKLMQIVEYPKILIIQLVRFYSHTNKDSRKIDVDGILQFKNTKYKIVGYACHSGTVRNGHYVSFGSRNGEWFYFDDEHYKKQESIKLNETDAYVLFYIAL